MVIRAVDDHLDRMVGRTVKVRTVDGGSYVGKVTAAEQRPEAGEWIQLNDRWWVALRHVTAAMWHDE